jgi:hypothetical protein
MCSTAMRFEVMPRSLFGNNNGRQLQPISRQLLDKLIAEC